MELLAIYAELKMVGPLILVAVPWLQLGLVTAIIAWLKKRRGGRWCLYALLAAPFALGHVLWLGTVRCPHCARKIRADISGCAYCQRGAAEIGLWSQGLDRPWQRPLFLQIALGIVLLGWLVTGFFVLGWVRGILMRQIITMGHIVSLSDVIWRLMLWLRYTSGLLALIFLGLAGRKVWKHLLARWVRVAQPPSATAERCLLPPSYDWTVAQIPLGLLVGILGLVFLFATMMYGSHNLPVFSLVSFLPALALLLMISLWCRE